MGKSPGRWIKTVLFGKKNSKSNLSKNAAHKKVSGKVPMDDPSGDSPVLSNPCVVTERDTENLELENNTSGVPCGTDDASFPVNQGVESQRNHASLPVSDDDTRKEGQAAAIVQAAFRGYLARRAFWALKGIIRLQALIRGHLVRRQAGATLRCMHAIVKFQALARGRRVRLSSTYPELSKKHRIEQFQDPQPVDIGANSILRSEKLATHAYVRKLLLSLPIAVPLSFQYDLSEPNSAWNWLERWSIYRFWEPPAQTKRVVHVKPQKKQGASRAVEADSGKLKGTVRKASTTANGDHGASASFEVDNPKRNLRKVVTSHQSEAVQEHPQDELAGVKCNLKKVSASATTAGKPEIETEKPLQQLIAKPVSSYNPPEVSEQELVVAAGTPDESDINKRALVETPEIKIGGELVDIPHDGHLPMENGSKVENTPVHEKTSSNEDEIGKENKIVRKRRSLPIKQDYEENITQNTPTLPSYMAATQSAKARLRAQGSPKFSEDGAEQGYVRRHSLPAPTNGKLSSLSPRIQKPVQTNGKGSNKTNRPVTSSRDDKVLQPGWRR